MLSQKTIFILLAASLLIIFTIVIYQNNFKKALETDSESTTNNGSEISSNTNTSTQTNINKNNNSVQNEDKANTESPQEKAEENDEESRTNNKNEHLAAFISEYHEVFNRLTNDEKYKEINWNDFNKLGDQLIEEVNDFSSDEVPDEMKLDFSRIIDLTKIGQIGKETNVAIYIHRIFHDLDVEYNGYKQTKFGFSNYDGGGAEQFTVSSFIKEHQKQVDTE